MIEEAQIQTLEGQSDDELRSLIQEDVHVSEAIFLSNPKYAEDAGYEPFSADWIKRYSKSLLAEVGDKPFDMVLEWALTASAAQIATALVVHFGIALTSYPAAIALALLLIRAATKARDGEDA